LGRAFLQATFIGSNFESGITWLAQAPGPGLDGRGLGQIPQIIDRNSSTLDVFPDDDGQLFITSWQPYWRTANNSGTTKKQNNGLTTGAKAGIGIGITVGVLIFAWLAYLLWTKLRRSGSTGILNSVPELQAEDERKVELHGNNMTYELPPHNLPVELHASTG
jgi:hypothetical protein